MVATGIDSERRDDSGGEDDRTMNREEAERISMFSTPF